MFTEDWGGQIFPTSLPQLAGVGEQGGGGDQTRGLSGLHVRQQEEEEAGERQSSGHGVVWCGVVWSHWRSDDLWLNHHQCSMDQRGQAWTWTAVADVDATDNSSDVLLLTHEEKCFLQEDLLPSVRLYIWECWPSDDWWSKIRLRSLVITCQISEGTVEGHLLTWQLFLRRCCPCLHSLGKYQQKLPQTWHTTDQARLDDRDVKSWTTWLWYRGTEERELNLDSNESDSHVAVIWEKWHMWCGDLWSTYKRREVQRALSTRHLFLNK